MRRRIALALGCAAWLACAHAPATDEAAPAPAASASAEPFAGLPFALPGSSLTATAAARGVRFEPDPGAPGQSVAHFDLGAANPAVCTFSPRADSKALSAHLLAAVVAGAIQTFSPGVAPELASRVRAGALGRAPFLSLDVAMSHENRGVLVMQRLAVRHERVVHCVWVAVDGGPTFDHLFTSLVQTLAIAPEPPGPLHGAVYSIHVDGEPAGVIEIAIAREPGGVLRMERRSALLLPTRDGGRLPIDQLETERTRADGTLLSAHSERHEGYAAQLALQLDPAGRGAWRAHGTVGGTAVDERFQAPAPSSYLLYVRAVRDAARARRVGVPIRERQWAPDLAVGGFSESVTTLEETETGALRGSERMGANVFSFAIDADGLLDSGWIQRGGVRLEQRRELAFGPVPGPGR